MKKRIIIIVILALTVTSIVTVALYKGFNKISNNTNTKEATESSNSTVNEKKEEIKMESVEDPYHAREDVLEFVDEEEYVLEFEDTSLSNDSSKSDEEFHEPGSNTNNDKEIVDPNALPDYVKIDNTGQITIDLSGGDNKTPVISD